MKVNTPLGQYPFEFRRIEWRGDTVVVVGTVAGLESSVVLGREDLLAVAKPLAPVVVLGALGALGLLRGRR